MTAYHQAPFTIDAYRAIPDEPAPAVGVEEYGTEDEIAQAHDEYVTGAAGPLALSLDDSAPMTLAATVDGIDGATLAYLGWGDGHGTDLLEAQQPVEHRYEREGNYSVAATATVDGVSYGIGKDRWVIAPVP